MKKFIYFLFMLTIFGAVYIYREQIAEKLIEYIIPKEEVTFDYKNSYYLSYNFNYLNKVDNTYFYI